MCLSSEGVILADPRQAAQIVRFIGASGRHELVAGNKSPAQAGDFAERCKALSAVADDGVNPDIAFALMQRWSDGQIKMLVTRKALRYRLQYPELRFWFGAQVWASHLATTVRA